MKKIKLPKVELKGRAKKFVVKTKIKSPAIMIVVGTVGVVGGTIMACRASMKLKDVLDEGKEAVNDIHEYAESDEAKEKGYTEKDEKKAVVIENVKTAGKVAKLYAPAVIVEAAGLGCMIGSNHILTKRNIGLAGAYAAVQKEFKEYRDRVVDRFGEDLDRELKHNITKAEYKEKETDEDGKTKTVKKSVDVAGDGTGYSGYSKFFDEASREFTGDPEHDKWYVLRGEELFNNKLRMNGFVFLNDIYDYFDIPRTKQGQTDGWVYDPEHPDAYPINFDIMNVEKEANRRFVNGYEPSILLEFKNCSYILDKIK